MNPTVTTLPAPGANTLDRHRVYIIPTRHGCMLAAMLVVILLGAINYDNALGYLLCFLLAGIVLTAMLHTYRNLAGLRLAGVRAAPVFAGDRAQFELLLEDPGARPRYALTFARSVPEPKRFWRRRAHEAEVHQLALEGGQNTVCITLPAPRRGRLSLGRVRISSQFPLGLLRAWAYFVTDAACLVYPAPRGALPLPYHTAGGVNTAYGAAPGSDDFGGLRGYTRGDAIRTIHWPSVAKDQETLVKRFHGGGVAEVWLRWPEAGPGNDTEARLSQLSQWVLAAEHAGARYGLELPGEHIPLGGGPAHRGRVLAALALYRAP